MIFLNKVICKKIYYFSMHILQMNCLDFEKLSIILHRANSSKNIIISKWRVHLIKCVICKIWLFSQHCEISTLSDVLVWRWWQFILKPSYILNVFIAMKMHINMSHLLRRNKRLGSSFETLKSSVYTHLHFILVPEKLLIQFDHLGIKL